jgi:DNA polymerase-3 subunit chi
VKPRIFFLILESDNKKRIVCDITEKLYQAERRSVFFVKESALAKDLDRMLWIWKQSSFIPHVYSERLDNRYDEPVVITSQIDKVENFNTLILYDPAPLEVMSRFDLVVDFAEKYNQTSLLQSRERYRQYQKNEWPTESLPPGQFLQMPLS